MNKYKRTIYACFAGYVVQAIVNNFVPLLFITFQTDYNIPLSKITLLITVNFIIQLFVDLLSAGLIEKIGYRISIVTAHILAAAGLLLLIILPEISGNSFAGLLSGVVVYALGGGLIEVLISPIMEACPTENKEKAMSLLHSFYCWGHVAVVLLSTIFFSMFGTAKWKLLALLWALIPIFNGILFTKVPIAPLNDNDEEGLKIKELFSKKLFWTFMLMMLCAGASEQAVSQWASTLAEKGLGVNKTIGDLAGPMAFAALMGSARAFYGKCGERINLDRFMVLNSIVCIFSYLTIALIPYPIFGLIGCGICGWSVGIMWPGTFSKAAASIKGGGISLFALLALAGDLGCTAGPTLTGFVSSWFGDDLKAGILSALIFPLLMIAGIIRAKHQLH